MSDIAARLDEDEAIARLAAREGGTWTQEDPVRFPGNIVSLGGHVVYDEGAPDENQAPHIARHDPARVLREVEAKRGLLRLAPECPDDCVDHGNEEHAANEATREAIRSILAAIYEVRRA